ncbi:MAG: hypothetical protein IJN94_04425 [Clostridia bacterium]|nr:hypothetical protein [Clostridia bacterium]
MTKKQFIRSIAFFMAVAVMVLALCDLFDMDNTYNYNQRYCTYRNFPKDTVDAVILGTSGVDRYWIPSQAYEEYGITVYPLSTDAFPAWLYKYAVDEALRFQDVDLLILDIRPFTLEECNINDMDIRARRFLDALTPFSINRIKGCFETMKIRDDVDKSASRLDLSYLFPIIKFHGKWADDDYSIANNWSSVPHEYLGYNIIDNATVRPRPQEIYPYDADYYVDLNPYIETYFYEFLDYIKELQASSDIEVLFIDTPQVRLDVEMGISNKIYKIIEEEGFECVHYYDENSETTFSIDLDLNTDFYNEGHTNFYGGQKFTTIFSKYLIDNYDLKDRRDDPKVQKHWDGVHDKLLNKIAELEEARKNKLDAAKS